MSELVDLVNSSGEVVERGVERDDAKQHVGLHMQIVIAVIFNSTGDVLAHERAKHKLVNGGDIDHVCGGILSGETPEDAVVREAGEEVGVTPKNLRNVRKGVNSYGRYCYLYIGQSDEIPSPDLNEATWAAFCAEDNLREGMKTGKLTFVDGFFEDIEVVKAVR